VDRTTDTRVWYDFQIKAFDADERRITGIATTPEPDRRGDVIDPLGLEFAAELPLLLFHDKERPVGVATFGRPTAAGVTFTAWLKPISDPPALRDRIEEAWQSIRAGFLKGVSIGYRAVPDWIKPLATGGYHFTRAEVVELSLVTVPANPSATITGIKAFDLAASGRHVSAVADVPAVPNTMQTIQEQISHWTGVRGPLLQRMTDMMSGRTTTLDGNEAKTYDDLAGQLSGCDDQLRRLSVLEKANMAAAAPIVTKAGDVRTPTIQVRSAELPKGHLFVRSLMCLARAKGDGYQALQYARQFDSTPEVELWVKAAVAPGSTTDPAWAGVLAQVSNITGEFIDLLRPATILGQMPTGGANGLRKVPFNVTVPAQTAGGSYGWVGQGAPKPVTKLAFGTTALGIAKAAGIIIITDELAKLSTPAAEELVRNDMIKGIAQFLDQQFIDPAIAEVPNISPASITNGIAPIASTGDAVADLHAIISAFATANVSLGSLTLIMSETNAFTLGWQRDPVSGARLFPGIGVKGGNAEGFNVITSNTANGWVIGVAAPYILYADDGQVTVDVSKEASVQMDSAPMNPPDATVVMRSLWQENLVGLRAERYVNWKRITPNAVKFVSGATYTPSLMLNPATGRRQPTPAVDVEPETNHKRRS
jgi:HK97 family phage major capsid protein/HK97 family phage prohead protease